MLDPLTQMMQATYPEGTRVELDSCRDPHTRLRPGERGTVTMVDSLGTVHIQWDSGSTLGLIPGEDRWHAIHPDWRPGQ